MVSEGHANAFTFYSGNIWEDQDMFLSEQKQSLIHTIQSWCLENGQQKSKKGNRWLYSLLQRPPNSSSYMAPSLSLSCENLRVLLGVLSSRASNFSRTHKRWTFPYLMTHSSKAPWARKSWHFARLPEGWHVEKSPGQDLWPKKNRAVIRIS